jgi:hypothetical protein
VHASVGGKIAQLGQRLIDGVAKSMAEDFFKRFDEEMQRQHPQAYAGSRCGGRKGLPHPRQPPAAMACPRCAGLGLDRRRGAGRRGLGAAAAAFAAQGELRWKTWT